MNLKAKLTSRKFWIALAEFVSMMIVAFGGNAETATQVTALIMAGAGVLAYIVAEGLVDSANAAQDIVIDDLHTQQEPPDSNEA